MSKEKIARQRYLLTLYRQDIVNAAGNKEEDSGYGQHDMFIMDYFDRLEVKAVSDENDFADFWGIKERVYLPNDAMAVQSYSIYRDLQQEEKEDIFNGYADCPYIGLLYVYITPDVIAGLKKSMVFDLDEFENQLNILLDRCTNEDMAGRVFRMMSAGDFMIVIRSRRPESAFSFSTCIRELMISGENKPENCLAVFKTYTILGIKYIDCKTVSDTSGGIAIRGRYSNHYWKDRNSVQLPVLKEGDMKALYGRYDFCIYLSLQEFAAIYESLTAAKGISGAAPTLPENSSAKVKYLFELLQRDYLSYVNERYFMDMSEGSVEKSLEKLSPDIRILECIHLSEDCATDVFIKNLIGDRCGRMIERICKIEQEMRTVIADRRTFLSTIQLLLQLLSLCRNANNLSEIRIYIISLLEQMSVVMDSVEKWFNIYRQTKDTQFLDAFEEYFREAVTAMNSYGRIIRDDNFQTLQSPRYKIVSGCSMEKILLGYSAFLHEIMRFSSQALHTLGVEINKEYFPVMIPNLNRRSVMVKVLFPEWRCDVTEKYVGPDKMKQYLMVVEGPATEELLEVSYIVTTLFHEMAHHLRYESRDVRNWTLTRIILSDISEAAAQNILDEAGEEAGTDSACLVQRIFADAIYDVLESYFKEHRELLNGNLSLESFKYLLQDTMNDLIIRLQQKKPKLEEDIRHFIQDTNEFVIVENENFRMRTKNLWQSMTRLMKFEDISSKAAISAQEKEDMLLLAKRELENNIIQYKDCCMNADEESKSAEIEKDLNRIADMARVSVRYYQPENSSPFEKDISFIYDELYKEVSLGWKEQLAQMSSYASSMKEMLRYGRLLGIDYDSADNRKMFFRFIRNGFRKMDQYSFEEGFKEIALYREETSDLFMCSMCELSISGYLTVCARMDASDHGIYASGYVERFTDVMIIQWLSEKGKWEEDIPGRVLENALDQFNEVLKKLFGEKEEGKCGQIKALQDKLEKICSREGDQDRCAIARLMLQILGEIQNRMNRFESQQYIYEDLWRGKEVFRGLRESFESSEETGVDIIRNFCFCNQEYLNSFGSFDKNELKRRHQMACEDFLMKMAAFDKFKSARDTVYGSKVL